MRLCLALVFLSACTQVSRTFTCSADAQCGARGICDTSMSPRFCLLPDPTCPSQYRYDSSAGAFGGMCSASDGGMTPIIDAHAPDATIDMRAGDMYSGLGSPSLCDVFSGFACNGFELSMDVGDMRTPKMPWTYLAQGGGYVRAEPTHTYRGAYGEHMHAPATTSALSAAQLSVGGLPTTVGKTVYARTFVWIDTLPSIREGFFAVEESGGQYLATGLDVDTDGTLEVWTSTVSPAPPNGKGQVLHTKTWTCIELAIDYEYAGGSVRVKVNDVADPGLVLSGIATSFPTNMLVSGLYNQPNGSALAAWDIYMDEIAVDTNPIGCEH